MPFDLVFRLVVGGAVVCAFAVIGDVLKPKSFAGISGAAPSVALATVGLTLILKGPAFTATEGRSMILGAAALMAYCLLANRLLVTHKLDTVVASGLAFSAWFVVALGLWAAFLR